MIKKLAIVALSITGLFAQSTIPMVNQTIWTNQTLSSVSASSNVRMLGQNNHSAVFRITGGSCVLANLGIAFTFEGSFDGTNYTKFASNVYPIGTMPSAGVVYLRGSGSFPYVRIKLPLNGGVNTGCLISASYGGGPALQPQNSDITTNNLLTNSITAATVAANGLYGAISPYVSPKIIKLKVDTTQPIAIFCGSASTPTGVPTYYYTFSTTSASNPAEWVVGDSVSPVIGCKDGQAIWSYFTGTIGTATINYQVGFE